MAIKQRLGRVICLESISPKQVGLFLRKANSADSASNIVDKPLCKYNNGNQCYPHSRFAHYCKLCLGSHVGELGATGVMVYLREREGELIRTNPTKEADWEFYKTKKEEEAGIVGFKTVKIQTIYIYEKLGGMVSF